MNILPFIAVAMAASALVGCNPSADKNDPIRVEFIKACEGLVEYRSMKPKKRTQFCECGYDQTMKDLSEEEKQVARFYFVIASGCRHQSRRTWLPNPAFNFMGTASKAIGDAVKRCR